MLSSFKWVEFVFFFVKYCIIALKFVVFLSFNRSFWTSWWSILVHVHVTSSLNIGNRQCACVCRTVPSSHLRNDEHKRTQKTLVSDRLVNEINFTTEKTNIWIMSFCLLHWSKNDRKTVMGYQVSLTFFHSFFSIGWHFLYWIVVVHFNHLRIELSNSLFYILYLSKKCSQILK